MNQRHFTRLNIFPLVVSASGLLALLAGCPAPAPECASDADCDDGLFCNGLEVCDGNICTSSANPCAEDETCDEDEDSCTAPPCTSDADCADGSFCNGAETCVGGECQDGASPCAQDYTCDEIADSCTTIVNIDAKTNAANNPVVIYFDVGEYEVLPISVTDGGAYTAWSAHLAAANTWLHRYTLSSSGFPAQEPGGAEPYYADADEAFAHAVSTTFTLANVADVNFYVCDGPSCYAYAGDNVGGVSLRISIRCFGGQDCPDCVKAAHCDDGLFCNGLEVCNDGLCTSSGNPCAEEETCDEDTDSCPVVCVTDDDCDDGNVCTDDTCDRVSAECAFANNTGACDDDDTCTESDACANGVCAGTPIACAQGETCVSGVCVRPCVASGECDDGNFCNGSETCVDEFCAAGESPCQACEFCYTEARECRSDPGVFREDFESGNGLWAPDQGIWQIGVPASGPGTAFSGVALAATVLDGNYPHNSSRLISPSLELPEICAVNELYLRFQHWFSFGSFSGCSNFGGGGSPACGTWSDSGNAQVREETAPGQWTEWTTLASYFNESAVFTNVLIDLTQYAGKKVQIGFLLSYGSRVADAEGWYIDDVTIDVF